MQDCLACARVCEEAAGDALARGARRGIADGLIACAAVTGLLCELLEEETDFDPALLELAASACERVVASFRGEAWLEDAVTHARACAHSSRALAGG